MYYTVVPKGWSQTSNNWEFMKNLNLRVPSPSPESETAIAEPETTICVFSSLNGFDAHCCLRTNYWCNALQNRFKYIFFLLQTHNPVMQVRNYWPRFIYKKAIFKSHLTVIKCVSNNSTQRMGTNFLICQLFWFFNYLFNHSLVSFAAFFSANPLNIGAPQVSTFSSNSVHYLQSCSQLPSFTDEL